MKTTVRDRQSLLDVALGISGSMDGAMRIATRNRLPLTAELIPGQEIMFEAEDIADGRTVSAYTLERIIPATELSNDDISGLLQEGIGFMGIEIDFKVN